MNRSRLAFLLLPSLLAASLAVAAVASGSCDQQLPHRSCASGIGGVLDTVGVQCPVAWRVVSEARSGVECQSPDIPGAGCVGSSWPGPWSCEGRIGGRSDDFTCTYGMRSIHRRDGG